MTPATEDLFDPLAHIKITGEGNSLIFCPPTDLSKLSVL